jgi:hypothetical protein
VSVESPDLYDLFISYRSEDANLVRPVAETLLAAGLDVWFAEYQVLLANYAQFQAEVDRGIDLSRYALVFTNDRWAASKWCRLDIDRIIPPLGADRVLEVCIPPGDGPHAYRHELGRARSMVWDGRPEAVVEFIRAPTPLALPAGVRPSRAASSGSGRVRRLRFGGRFDPGPMREVDAPIEHVFRTRREQTCPGESHSRGSTRRAASPGGSGTMSRGRSRTATPRSSWRRDCPGRISTGAWRCGRRAGCPRRSRISTSFSSSIAKERPSWIAC